MYGIWQMWTRSHWWESECAEILWLIISESMLLPRTGFLVCERDHPQVALRLRLLDTQQGCWLSSRPGHWEEGWDELGRVCHGLFRLYCNVSFLVWLLLPHSNPEYRLCGFEGDISFRNESAQPGIRREKQEGNGKKITEGWNDSTPGMKAKGEESA